MKKVYFLLAFTGFTMAAASQQNDFFDIEKHLKKKRADNKKIITPLLSNPLLQKKFSITSSSLQAILQKRYSYQLFNGDKVYLLSQDNMPCIIPDMKQYKRMPNISGRIANFETITSSLKRIPGIIPNAADPHK